MYLFSLLAKKSAWYFFLFDTPMNAARSVALWLTLGWIAAFVALALTLPKDKKPKFFKISLFASVAYACVIGAIFLALSIKEDGLEKILFVPLACLVLAVASSLVTLSFKRTKRAYFVCGSVVAAAFVATLVCMGVHFASGNAAESNWLKNEDVQSAALYVFAVLAAALVVCLGFLFDRKNKSGFDTKSITYAAVCIAMSFALSYVRVVKLPQGGSITVASLLPLMLYSYLFGTKKGVFAGVIYGILQALQSPNILHPAQFLLDYPLAFASVGLAGAFRSTKAMERIPRLSFALGGLIAGLGRFVMHFLSGWFAFGAFAPSGNHPALYSFVYQAGYVLPDLVIALAVGVALFSSKPFCKAVKKFQTPTTTEA